VASFKLLDALSAGADTITSVAAALGIPDLEAKRRLSAATTRGLVIWADRDDHFTEIDMARRSVRLSTPGLMELELLRLQEAATD
jgi:hypothetical protein